MFSFMWFLISSAVIAGMLVVSMVVSTVLAFAWGWIDDQDEVDLSRSGVFRILCRKATALCSYRNRSGLADSAIRQVTKRDSRSVKYVSHSQEKALREMGVSDFHFRGKVMLLRWELLLLAVASPIIFWLAVTFWLPLAVILTAYALAKLARGARRLSKRLKLHEADPDAHKKVASDEA